MTIFDSKIRLLINTEKNSRSFSNNSCFLKIYDLKDAEAGLTDSKHYKKTDLN